MAGMVSPRVSSPARLRQMVKANASETSVESNDTPAGHSMTFEDLPEEIRQKLFNEDLSLRDLSAMSQVSKDSRARVQETMEKLNSKMSIPPTAFASREENLSAAASALASTTSCWNIIVSLRHQLRITDEDPAELSSDEVLNELQKQAVIHEMDSLRWDLQKPIRFSERADLMNIGLMQLKTDREALEKKEKTIKIFCEEVVKNLALMDTETRERDDEALKTGLRFIICDQFRTELDSTNKQIQFSKLQMIRNNKFTFNVNGQTYGIIQFENHNLLFFKKTSQSRNNENYISKFKIEIDNINNRKIKKVQKVGSDQPETIWVEARYANDDVYEGQWVNGMMHGEGIVKDKSGKVIYEGQWADGKMNGKGIHTFANGDVYDGEFVNGIAHGYGITKAHDGGVYVGNKVNGKADGDGIYKYPNGDVYDGKWKDGKKHGTGTYKYADDDFFEGQWENGLKQGEFKVTKKDGTICRCQYDNSDLKSWEFW